MEVHGDRNGNLVANLFTDLLQQVSFTGTDLLDTHGTMEIQPNAVDPFCRDAVNDFSNQTEIIFLDDSAAGEGVGVNGGDHFCAFFFEQIHDLDFFVHGLALGVVKILKVGVNRGQAVAFAL